MFNVGDKVLEEIPNQDSIGIYDGETFHLIDNTIYIETIILGMTIEGIINDDGTITQNIKYYTKASPKLFPESAFRLFN